MNCTFTAYATTEISTRKSKISWCGKEFGIVELEIRGTLYPITHWPGEWNCSIPCPAEEFVAHENAIVRGDKFEFIQDSMNVPKISHPKGFPTKIRCGNNQLWPRALASEGFWFRTSLKSSL